MSIESHMVADGDWPETPIAIPPRKRPMSMRLDADVLDYFRAKGSGYQKLINAVLRTYMQRDKARSESRDNPQA